MTNPKYIDNPSFIDNPYMRAKTKYAYKIVKKEGSTIAIIYELPDNHGMSVTNAIERVASYIRRIEKLDPYATIWLETYKLARSEYDKRYGVIDVAPTRAVMEYDKYYDEYKNAQFYPYKEIIDL